MQEVTLLEIIVVIACSTFMLLCCGWNGGRSSQYAIRARLLEIERERREESMPPRTPWPEHEKRTKSRE